MKSLIRLLLIICGISTNIYTISLLHGSVNTFVLMFLGISNMLALTWAVVLREVFGWDRTPCCEHEENKDAVYTEGVKDE